MKKLCFALALSVLLLSTLTGCGLTVPRPEIKSGEFDFSVTYLMDGETKTVSGVYVCEYNGTSWALDGGTHRSWKGYLRDGKLDELMDLGTTKDGKSVSLDFGFYPEYFMGDPELAGREVPAPYLTVFFENGEEVVFENDAKVIEETYGIKIVSYQYEAPIENSFGLFK